MSSFEKEIKMAKTKLYIIRHGKTMFNTIGRAQGWSDTPLVEFIIPVMEVPAN